MLRIPELGRAFASSQPLISNSNYIKTFAWMPLLAAHLDRGACRRLHELKHLNIVSPNLLVKSVPLT